MANLSHAVSTGQERNLTDQSISPLVQVIDGVARVDSRLIARELNISHGFILDYTAQTHEQFEIFGDLHWLECLPNKRKPCLDDYLLLNEHQACLFLSLLENDDRKTSLAVRLIKEFGYWRGVQA